MRTRVVIQSRLSSSRLPGKALMSVAGMPLIELVARRASRGDYEVIVATSVEPYDDRIAQHLEKVGVPVMRGSLDDVLGRFVDATADMAPEDRVVRLTGDNPVADTALVEELLAAMDKSGHTYGRVDVDKVPEGLGAEGFTVEALRQAGAQATRPYDREHVTPWLRRELGELLFAPSDNPGDPVAYRCTTDCLNDYDRISRLFDDEEDPIGVPWNQLVAKLKTQVDAEGPMAPVSERSGDRLTKVLLGTRRIGVTRSGGLREGAIVRDVFATAVNRGVSHVLADPGMTEVVRQGTVPALQQRLGIIAKLLSFGRRVSAEHLICQVSASVERCFADVGRRHLSGVLVPSLDDVQACEGAGWNRLRDYCEHGLVDEIGVAVRDTREIARLDEVPGLTMAVVPITAHDQRFLAQAISDRLGDLAARGVTILAELESCDPQLAISILNSPFVDAVVVDAATAKDLEQVLAVV